MNRRRVVAIDGGWRPADQASVSAFDHGLTVGDGVFETLQVVRATPFAAPAPPGPAAPTRWPGSAWTCPSPTPSWASAMAQVISANQLDQGRLRLTVTGGVSPLGSDRGRAGPTVVVATGPLPAWEATTAVVTVPWTRNERSAVAGLKTTSYAENVVALDRAHAAGASEAVFANTVGELCEGTGSNVFVGIGGRLLTPPLSSGCLAGITRGLVCELVEVDERDLPLDALTEADEAFLTSSTRDVQAISAIDGRAVSAPGPLTAAAATALADLMARDLDP